MLSSSEFDGSVSINVLSDDSIMKVWNDEYDDPYLCCRIDSHRLKSFDIANYTGERAVTNECDDYDMRWHKFEEHGRAGALFCIWLYVDEHTTHGLLLRQVGAKASEQPKGLELPVCERLGTIWRMTGEHTMQILKGSDSRREAQELYLI